jgi:hypothetical protein
MAPAGNNRDGIFSYFCRSIGRTFATGIIILIVGAPPPRRFLRVSAPRFNAFAPRSDLPCRSAKHLDSVALTTDRRHIANFEHQARQHTLYCRRHPASLSAPSIMIVTFGFRASDVDEISFYYYVNSSSPTGS